MGIDSLFGGFYRGKTVLVTGHTGFKGSWLSLVLELLGARVIGYALKPLTGRDNFVLAGLKRRMKSITGDMRDFPGLAGVFKKHKADIVFHLAAQPIVRLSHDRPKETFDVNSGGTVNLLECAKLAESVKSLIIITSDKCYRNDRDGRPYREGDAMGGDDPYSASKGCAELAANAYLQSYYLESKTRGLATVRAGNVLGGGDWQSFRLIPDCIRSLENDGTVSLRNPGHVRPWQHVLEPLLGYLLLGYRMWQEPEKYSGAWNFGPDSGPPVSVKELAAMIVKAWGGGKITESAKSGDPPETRLLALDCAKAKSQLGWQPVLHLSMAVELTVEWYKKYKIEDCYDLDQKQIKYYIGEFVKVIGL